MQSIGSAALAMILTVANPAPCAPSDRAGEPAPTATGQRLASHLGFGLPRLPSLPQMPRVPHPKWP